MPAALPPWLGIEKLNGTGDVGTRINERCAGVGLGFLDWKCWSGCGDRYARLGGLVFGKRLSAHTLL